MHDQEAPVAVRKPMRYRQTMMFAATAIVVMAIAATFAATKVNNAIAGVAEKQVIDLAEENTTRDALHIQSMVVGGNSMIGMGAGHTMDMSTDGSMAMESDGGAVMGAGHTMDMSTDGSMAMESDVGAVMDGGHTMTNGAGTMDMSTNGSMMAMESDSETAMEGGHTMTNGAGESVAMTTNGPVTQVAVDSDSGAAMQVNPSMGLGRAPLSLDLLTGPSGLPMHYSMLVEGLGVVESILIPS